MVRCYREDLATGLSPLNFKETLVTPGIKNSKTCNYSIITFEFQRRVICFLKRLQNNACTFLAINH